MHGNLVLAFFCDVFLYVLRTSLRRLATDMPTLSILKIIRILKYFILCNHNAKATLDDENNALDSRSSNISFYTSRQSVDGFRIHVYSNCRVIGSKSSQTMLR